MRRLAAVVAATLALGLAACGGDDDEPTAIQAPSTCVAPAGRDDATITSGGVERTFLQDVPPGATSGAPLVIGLHGYGASGAHFQLASKLLATAQEEGFVLLTPDALPDANGYASWDTWPTSADVRFVEDLIGHAVRELCVDPGRVHVTGHSQGGFFISTLACTTADRIASVVPIAGMRPAPPGCAPAEPVALLAFHDTGDAIVPYDGGLPVNLAAKLGLPAEGPSIPEIVEAWAELHEGVAVRLETTRRYDHGWPEEANEMMWAFFERTTRCRRTSASCPGVQAAPVLRRASS